MWQTAGPGNCRHSRHMPHASHVMPCSAAPCHACHAVCWWQAALTGPCVRPAPCNVPCAALRWHAVPRLGGRYTHNPPVGQRFTHPTQNALPSPWQAFVLDSQGVLYC